MLRRVVFLLGLTVTAYAGLPPGRPLPDVPISGAGGKKLDLKKYRGKALVLTLIATTCEHCTEVVEVLKKLQTEEGAHGLRVVVAAGDENGAAVIGPYATAHQPNFPMGYVDRPALMKLANVMPKDRPFVPIMLFVDAKGVVRVQMFGNDPLLEKPEVIIRSTVRELLKEPGITAATTKK
jgi:thiol-disulfide isomerase/thioredoxin